ncbi:MAG: transporter substrate-binding domain-containing protein [Nibricoccus sp.]
MKAFHRLSLWLLVSSLLLTNVLSAESKPSGPPPLLVGVSWARESVVPPEQVGTIDRFEVKLAIAVARTQGRTVKIRLAPLDMLLRELSDGKIDFIPGIARTPDRQKNFDFSVPHNRLHTQLFVRRGYKLINSVADLPGHKVIIVRGSYSHGWAVERGLGANVIEVADLDEGVRRLAAGEGDCLMAKQLNMFAAMKAAGVTNIEVRGPPIQELLQDLCIAVRGGNRDMLATVNEALFQLKQTGELDRLYERWLGLLDMEDRSFARYGRYLIFGVSGLLLLGAAAWAAHMVQLGRTRARLAEIEMRVKERTAELTAAKARFEAVVTNTPATMLLLDPHDQVVPGRIVDCNETACRMHGYSREELLGQSINLIRVETLSSQEFATIISKLRVKKRGSGMCHHRCKDGSLLNIEFYSTLLQIGGQEYVLAVDLDVTDRIRTETALRRNEEFQRLVLRASNDGIFDWDIGADRFVLSAHGWQLLGLAEPTEPGKRKIWRDRLHPDDRKQADDLLEQHLRTGAPFVQTARYLHTNGSIRWLLCRADTMRDVSGQPVRMVGSYSDVTEQKRNDEERRLRAMGELVGGIAHEFNNLLTPILLQASSLEETTAPSSEAATQVASVLDAARRAQALTRQLLQFGRSPDHDPAPQSLSTVVNGTLSLVRSTIDRRIEIQQEQEPALPLVRINAVTFGQVVMNLVLNARDALLEKAASAPPDWKPQLKVRVAACSAPDRSGRNITRDLTPCPWLRLSVIDNGAGMPPEIRERIFEPFFTTKAVGRGTGLGLAMVWRVVEDLGGWVEVESLPHRGTEFSLYLPVTAAAAADEVRSSVSEKPNVPVGKHRVLLAEDDEPVGSIVVRIFQRLGHEVVWFQTGDEALKSLRENPAGFYDALFTDLNMPGLGGEALVMSARAAGFTGKIAVVSGNIPSDVEQRLGRIEGVVFLQKPFELERIKSLLARLWSAPAAAETEKTAAST